MPVLTYGYNQLFNLVGDSIRTGYDMPFYETGSDMGAASKLTAGVGVALLLGTTTLASCGVDSPGKQESVCFVDAMLL